MQWGEALKFLRHGYCQQSKSWNLRHNRFAAEFRENRNFFFLFWFLQSANSVCTLNCADTAAAVWNICQERLQESQQIAWTYNHITGQNEEIAIPIATRDFIPKNWELAEENDFYSCEYLQVLVRKRILFFMHKKSKQKKFFS